MVSEGVQLEDLLDEQERRALTATVERSPRGDDYVRVTPFVPGVGCACQFGLDVKKEVLASLARTSETHL